MSCDGHRRRLNTLIASAIDALPPDVKRPRLRIGGQAAPATADNIEAIFHGANAASQMGHLAPDQRDQLKGRVNEVMTWFDEVGIKRPTHRHGDLPEERVWPGYAQLHALVHHSPALQASFQHELTHAKPPAMPLHDLLNLPAAFQAVPEDQRRVIAATLPALASVGVTPRVASLSLSQSMARAVPRCPRCKRFVATYRPVCTNPRCQRVGETVAPVQPWPPAGVTFKTSTVARKRAAALQPFEEALRDRLGLSLQEAGVTGFEQIGSRETPEAFAERIAQARAGQLLADVSPLAPAVAPPTLTAEVIDEPADSDPVRTTSADLLADVSAAARPDAGTVRDTPRDDPETDPGVRVAEAATDPDGLRLDGGAPGSGEGDALSGSGVGALSVDDLDAPAPAVAVTVQDCTEPVVAAPPADIPIAVPVHVGLPWHRVDLEAAPALPPMGASDQLAYYETNFSSLQVLQQLEQEDRPGTPDEVAVLAGTRPWTPRSLLNAVSEHSGVPHAGSFPYLDLLSKRRRNLSSQVWNSNTSERGGYEHYRDQSQPDVLTPHARVSAGLWDMLRQMGFRGGTVLDVNASMGQGLGTVPDDLRANSAFFALEPDELAARYRAKLNPGVDVQTGSFAKADLPDGFFDVALVTLDGYRWQERVKDSAFAKRLGLLTTQVRHATAKALDKVKPGGVVALTLPTGAEADLSDDDVRRYLASQADVLGYVQAGAAVANQRPDAGYSHAGAGGATLLLLRKRPAGLRPPSDWQLGTPLEWSTPDGTAAIVSQLPADGFAVGAARCPVCGEFYHPTTHVCRGPAQPVQAAGRDILPTARALAGSPHLQALMGLRQALQDVLNAERVAGQSHTEVALAALDDVRQILTDTYRGYIRDHGPVRSAETWAALEAYPGLSSVLTLEPPDVQPATLGTREFRTPFLTSQAPPTIETLEQAYLETQNIHGRLDLPYLAALLHRPPEAVADELVAAGLAYRIPGGHLETPEEFLSGNVRVKLRNTQLAIRAAQQAGDARLLAQVERSAQALKAVLPPLKTPGDITSKVGIMAALGAGWIPESDIEAFIDHLVPTHDHRKVSVRRNPLSGDWVLEQGAWRGRSSADNTAKWGTPQKTAIDLISASLNSRKVVVRRLRPLDLTQPVPARLLEDLAVNGQISAGLATQLSDDAKRLAARQGVKWPSVRVDLDATGGGRVSIDAAFSFTQPVVYEADEAATRQSRTMQRRLNEEFVRWLWSDPERAKRLTLLYNDQFNSEVPREWNGSHLTFPWMSADLQAREPLTHYQRNAIWRGVNSDFGCFFDAGAGKSRIMFGIALEGRRLGQFKKPVIVEPAGNMLPLRDEIQRVAPGAKVMVVEGHHVSTPEKRREYLRHVAEGDYDLILMTHDAFTRIPLSTAGAEQALQSDLAALDETQAQLEEQLKAAQQGNATNDRNALQRALARLATSRQRLVREAERNSVAGKGDLTWDMLGVDCLMVDEFQNTFKNFHGRTPAAVQALLKARQLKAAHPRGRLVISTGDPTTNEMSQELHTLQLWLQPEWLRANGVYTLNAWRRAYCEMEERFVPDPTGRGFVKQDRLARITNAGTLFKALGQNMEFRLSARDIPELAPHLPRVHGGKAVILRTGSYPELDAAMDLIVRVRRERDPVKRLQMTGGQPFGLWANTTLRRVALDPRLVPEVNAAPDHPNYKVNRVADYLVERRAATQAIKGLSLVYLDTGVEGGSSHISLHGELRDRLTRLGVPDSEIALVTGSTKPLEFEEIKSRARSGEIRVLIMHRSKGGTGVNVQDRATDVVHVDVPFRPDGYNQPNKRADRRGNRVEALWADALGVSKCPQCGRFISEQGGGHAPTCGQTTWAPTWPPEVQSRIDIERAALGLPAESEALQVHLAEAGAVRLVHVANRGDVSTAERVYDKATQNRMLGSATVGADVIEDTVGDVLLSEAELLAECMDNPAYKRKLELDLELGALIADRSLWEKDQVDARTQLAALGGHEALATSEARIRSLELARDFSERVTDQGLQLAVADVDPLLPHLPARSDIGARLEVWRAYDAIRDTHPSTPEKTAASLVQALPTDFSLDPDTYVTRIRQAFDRELEALQRLPEQASRAHSDRLRKAPAFPERGTSTEQIAWANDTLGLLRRATGVANRYGLQASLETLSTAYTRAARTLAPLSPEQEALIDGLRQDTLDDAGWDQVEAALGDRLNTSWRRLRQAGAPDLLVGQSYTQKTVSGAETWTVEATPATDPLFVKVRSGNVVAEMLREHAAALVSHQLPLREDVTYHRPDGTPFTLSVTDRGLMALDEGTDKPYRVTEPIVRDWLRDTFGKTSQSPAARAPELRSLADPLERSLRRTQVAGLAERLNQQTLADTDRTLIESTWADLVKTAATRQTPISVTQATLPPEDRLRALLSRLGMPTCPECGRVGRCASDCGAVERRAREKEAKATPFYGRDLSQLLNAAHKHLGDQVGAAYDLGVSGATLRTTQRAPGVYDYDLLIDEQVAWSLRGQRNGAPAMDYHLFGESMTGFRLGQEIEAERKRRRDLGEKLKGLDLIVDRPFGGAARLATVTTELAEVNKVLGLNDNQDDIDAADVEDGDA